MRQSSVKSRLPGYGRRRRYDNQTLAILALVGTVIVGFFWRVAAYGPINVRITVGTAVSLVCYTFTFGMIFAAFVRNRVSAGAPPHLTAAAEVTPAEQFRPLAWTLTLENGNTQVAIVSRLRFTVEHEGQTTTYASVDDLRVAFDAGGAQWQPLTPWQGELPVGRDRTLALLHLPIERAATITSLSMQADYSSLIGDRFQLKVVAHPAEDVAKARRTAAA